MSIEEMQFADPEWQPPGQLSSTLEQEQFNPQPVNIPREQHQRSFDSSNGKTVEKEEEEADYLTGYKARQQQHYASPPQQKHRRHTWRWVGTLLLLIFLAVLAGRPFIADGGYFVEGFVLDNLIVVLGILAFIFACIAFFRSRSRFSSRVNSTVETRDFLVGSHSTIIVHNGCGSIRILSYAERNQVRIQATRQNRGLGHAKNDAIHYIHRTEDNTVIIDSMDRWSIFGRSNIDYEISVPLMTDLELKTDIGKIDVSNVIGKMKLYNDAGSIYATQVSLHGKSTLKTDVGSIYFSGSIENQGTYKFLSDAGSINVNLPEDASFEVDAKTDVGSIRCNFPMNGHSKKSHTKLQGKVGNPPYATLTLKTDVGSITLKQA
ncbi:MAG: DUF4097 family beta strand repeat-containing protein [Ktedonobacteraceae bacterium]